MVVVLMAEMFGRGLSFRNVSEKDADRMKQTYVSTLMKYPIDAVMAVMRTSRGDWIPSCDILVKEIERLIEPRKSTYKTLLNGKVIDVKVRDRRSKLFDISEDIQKSIDEIGSAEWKADRPRYDIARTDLEKHLRQFEQLAEPSDLADYKNVVAEARKFLGWKFQPRIGESDEDKLSKRQRNKRNDLFKASRYSDFGFELRDTEPPYYVVFGKHLGKKTELVTRIKESECEAFIHAVENFKKENVK